MPDTPPGGEPPGHHAAHTEPTPIEGSQANRLLRVRSGPQLFALEHNAGRFSLRLVTRPEESQP